MVSRFFSFPFNSPLIVGASVLATGAVALAAVAGESAPSTRHARKAPPKPAETAAALVEEALIREIYGLDDDRDALLARAEKAAPNAPAVKWQRGMVFVDGKWTPAEEAATTSAAEALLAAYVAQRDKASDTLEGQLGMADWCHAKGLDAQEKAHLVRVLTFEPEHAPVRARLGFVRVGDEWVGRDEIARAFADEVRAQAAVARYRGSFGALARELASRDEEKRNGAADAIRAVRDVEAIPALEAIVAVVGEEASLVVLEALSGMPEKEAAVSLARFAALSPSLPVRDRAAKLLKDRKLDHFVPAMLASMAAPPQTQFAIGRGVDGRLVYRHALYREAMQSGQLDVLDVVYNGTRGAAEGENEAGRMQANSDFAARSAMIESFVTLEAIRTHELNTRIGETLEKVTDQQYGADATQWWNWWNQHNEVAVTGEKPRSVQFASHMVQTPQAQVQQAIAQALMSLGDDQGDDQGDDEPETQAPSEQAPVQNYYYRMGMFNGSWSAGNGPIFGCCCLAAGTTVLTNRGDVAIEQVRVGDLVLSQDVESGELAFKPVVEVTVRARGELLRVEHEGGSFRCSGGHPFWVSGEGWVSARNLKSGVELHALTGPMRVSSVSTDGAEPTYNLIVDGFSDYFVGESRILSHDNSIRRSTDAIVPGLAQK